MQPVYTQAGHKGRTSADPPSTDLSCHASASPVPLKSDLAGLELKSARRPHQYARPAHPAWLHLTPTGTPNDARPTVCTVELELLKWSGEG